MFEQVRFRVVERRRGHPCGRSCVRHHAGKDPRLRVVALARDALESTVSRLLVEIEGDDAFDGMTQHRQIAHGPPQQVVQADVRDFDDDAQARLPRRAARLCRTLGLDFHPCLTTPTFNGMPVRSNSLYKPVEGLEASATDRHRTVLSPAQSAALDATALPLYQGVVSRHGLG